MPATLMPYWPWIQEPLEAGVLSQQQAWLLNHSEEYKELFLENPQLEDFLASRLALYHVDLSHQLPQ